MDILRISELNNEQIYIFLEEFNIKHSKCFQINFISYEEINCLLTKLMKIVSEEESGLDLKFKCLNAIRILSRNRSQIFHHDLLNVLVAITQTHPRQNATEALKCLCNIVYNSENAQKFIGESNLTLTFIQRLRNYDEYSNEFKYYDIRLLFLITAFCAETRSLLFEAVPNLTEILRTPREVKAHVASITSVEGLQVEVLKLLFNITLALPHHDSIQSNKQQTCDKYATDMHQTCTKQAIDMHRSCTKQSCMHQKPQHGGIHNDVTDECNMLDNLTHVVSNLLVVANEELGSHSVNLLTNLPPPVFRHLLCVNNTCANNSYAQIVGCHGDASDTSINDCKETHNSIAYGSHKKIVECGDWEVNCDVNRDAKNIDCCFGDIHAPNGKKSHRGSSNFDALNFAAISKLIDFLRLKLEAATNKTEELSPILKCLSLMCASHGPIRRFCKAEILPCLRKEVLKLPEEGTTLRNQLCRLLTNPSSTLTNLAADLLFVLCKESVSRFVKYTGYGNAAGLLAERGLMAGGRPNNQYSSSSDSDTEEYKLLKDRVNPVTGRWEEAKADALGEMADEEKEFEVSKLINQIHRLTTSGVIRPVRIGEDGRPTAIDHVSQLLHENNQSQDSDSD